MVDLDEFLELLKNNVYNKNFYHFTDRSNLPGIQKYGILSMREIKRRKIKVEAPGGNQWSWDADERVGMDRYVHLCFFSQHPMEWRAREEGRIKESVFLTIDPAIIKYPGVLVTNEVSNKAGCVPQPPGIMLEGIDLEVIYTKTDWKDDAIKERLKTAKKYEILVPDCVPIGMITNLDNG